MSKYRWLFGFLMGILWLISSPTAWRVQARSASAPPAAEAVQPLPRPVAAPTNCAAVAETGIPIEECETLLDLYTSTNGPEWKDALLNGWNQNNSPCQWLGVQCRNGHVVGISRPNNNLVGTLPALDALSGLETLILNRNRLSGAIPDLSASPHLRQLTLSNNQLSGAPPDLSPLTDLVNLDLSANQLSGPIPDLSPLTHLEIVDLSRNQLSGSVPDLRAASRLFILNLNDNQLCGMIQPSLQDLTGLSTLNLKSNHLDASDPALIAWLNLKNPGWKETQTYRACTNCAVVTELPVSECRALLRLYDHTNGPNWTDSPGNLWRQNDRPCTWRGVGCTSGHVTGISLAHERMNSSLPSLNALPHLISLFLPANDLNGPIPDMSALTGLKYLNLSYNQLNGPIPDLTSWPRLEYLNLFRNQLSGPLPSLNHLTQLTYLDLSFNQLSGPIPNLNNLAQLVRFDLSYNQLSGPIPDLSALIRADRIYLDRNQLTGPIPNLNSLTNLVILSLKTNKLSGPIPDPGAMTRLQRLDLSFNELTGPIPPGLNQLAQLKYLDLNTNRLSGPVPSDLHNLTQLKYLDFSFNQLSGPIPNSSALISLERLYLDHNQLSGPIPDSSDFPSPLVWLYLNNNQLCGTVPRSLMNLNRLIFLNLKYNRLLTAVDPDLYVWLRIRNCEWIITQNSQPCTLGQDSQSLSPNPPLSPEFCAAPLRTTAVAVAEAPLKPFDVPYLDRPDRPLAAGEERYYRFIWDSEEPLALWLEVTPNEDADLYLWGPNDFAAPGLISARPGSDRISIATPEPGEYMLLVRGAAPATAYTLGIGSDRAADRRLSLPDDGGDKPAIHLPAVRPDVEKAARP